MSDSPFYQLILAEGALQARRTDVLAALAARFGKKRTAEFREVLNTITDEARLSKLHLAAVKCRSLTGFRRALQSRAS